MKNTLISLLTVIAVFLLGCDKPKEKNTLVIATSAEYPPFEYHENGKIIGFDIDLAESIAKELGKKVVFEDMTFSSILPALSNGQVDAAISTLTITPEREQQFDFSTPYYFEGLAVVFPKAHPIKTPTALTGKKIACQLGTTMEIWVKKEVPQAAITATDNNNQAIEALKAGHVQAVIIDAAQAAVFSSKNKELAYAILTQSKDGYGIAFKKNSALKHEVNQALARLAQKGEIQQLKDKWFGKQK